MNSSKTKNSENSWLLVSDVDGTLTEVVSVWEHFHKKLGKWDSEGLPNLKAFLNNEIDYLKFAELDALAYKGMSRQQMETIARRIPRRPGMEQMLTDMKNQGAVIALISSGLDILVDQIPDADVRVANGLKFENEVCTGIPDILIPIDGKKDAIEKLLETYPFPKDRIVVLGDSSGDIPMMEMAGFSVAVDPINEEVKRIADKVVDGSNLNDVTRLIENYFFH